jgi:hypothetical protein
MATSYVLDIRGLICGKNLDFFSTMSRPALGPTQHPIQWILGALSSGRQNGRGRQADHLLPSNTEAINGGIIAPSPRISSWRYG